MPESPAPAPEQPKEEPSGVGLLLNKLRCYLDLRNPRQLCEDLGKEVEETRHPFKSPEGPMFAEMKFESADPQKRIVELEAYVGKLKDKAPGVKTVATMIDALPEDQYSPVEKEWLKKFSLAVSKIESDGHYACLGPRINKPGKEHDQTRALGRYQIMPREWLKWSDAWLGGHIPAPDPAAQEYFAFKQFMKNYDELKKTYPDSLYFRFYAMATRWSGGSITEMVKGKPVPLMHEEVDYAGKILRAMGLKPTRDERAIQIRAEAEFMARKGPVRATERLAGKAGHLAKRGWKAAKRWLKD